MYEVYVESGPIEDEVALDPIADRLAGNLQVIGRGALVGIDVIRRTLNYSCTVDATDARLAIIMASSEFEAHLELLGVNGVRIQHAEADPERVNTDASQVRRRAARARCSASSRGCYVILQRQQLGERQQQVDALLHVAEVHDAHGGMDVARRDRDAAGQRAGAGERDRARVGRAADQHLALERHLRALGGLLEAPRQAPRHGGADQRRRRPVEVLDGRAAAELDGQLTELGRGRVARERDVERDRHVGLHAEGRRAGAAQADLLLHARHRDDGGRRSSRSVRRRIVSIITAQPARSSTALPVNTRVPLSCMPGAHERDRIADAHAQRLGLLAVGRAEVEEHLAQRDRLARLLRAVTMCAGLVPTTPITGPFAPCTSSTWSVSMRSSW